MQIEFILGEKMKKYLLLIALLLAISFQLFADCDMMAMIAKKDHYISWVNNKLGDLNDPTDYFTWLKSRSTNTGNKTNDDGYGVIYYPDDGTFDSTTQAWYQTDPNSYTGTYYTGGEPEWKTALDNAETTIMGDSTEASIVFGHARQGSVGEGNHPFYFDYGDKTFTMMHNGTLTSILKNPMYEFLDESGYLDANTSIWDEYNNYNSVSDWIDSEVMFRYLTYFINENDGNVVAGIHEALTKSSLPDVSVGSNIKNYLENPLGYYSFSLSDSTYKKVANFVFSDGENLYVFRNSPSDGNDYPEQDNYHNLSYEENYHITDVKTLDDLETRIDQFDFVIIPKYGEPFEIPNFLEIPHSAFITSDITSNQNWNETKYITSDITIFSGIILNIDAEVNFATHSTFNVLGTVNLQDDSEFNINHSSEVLVENNGELFLNWGSTITGATQTTYGATPPGHMVGGEPIIYGDRIIAQNGGIITTNDDYQNPGSRITITSSSDNLWDGIFIRDPNNLSEYWFVNCDISGISKLSIENINNQSTRNQANLNLYVSDFKNAGQIIVQDNHKLSIIGTDTSNRCNIKNNKATPIVVYNSEVNIDWAAIEDNGYTDQGTLLSSCCDGIYVSYVASQNSSITNTIFDGNTGTGVKTYSQILTFESNTVNENEDYGVYTYNGTFLPFEDNTISDNGYTEYVSAMNSYTWAGRNNNISDAINAGGNDQYILKAYNWNGNNHSIDVTGNTISIQDTSRFYPYFIAFEFDTPPVSPVKSMLISGMEAENNKDYSTAEQTYQLIITNYPESEEAAVAIRHLYYIENYTDQDFASLRTYIDAIQVSENSALYKVKEDIKTKSLMKEGEYVTAIDRLEEVINSTTSTEELVYAQIDEGYCYLQLSEAGSRSIPVNCRIRPASFDDYLKIVQDLERGLTTSEIPEDSEEIETVVAKLSHSNYPNPFNPTTTIAFSLPEESEVSVSIYNIKGQKVTDLTDEHYNKGKHSVIWNGKDANRKSVASGLYLYKISTDKAVAMKKIMLLK